LRECTAKQLRSKKGGNLNMKEEPYLYQKFKK